MSRDMIACPGRPQRRSPRGVATLTMVMVLFFVMAMVAAYTNRNLLYEQRMSINNFRATAAMSAADAGIDWAVAMLSGARVDANCMAPAAPVAADLSFRDRYTILQPDGTYSVPKWGAANSLFTPGCVLTNAGWTCKCPDLAVPQPALAFPANSAPTFQVEIDSGGMPGLLKVDVRGSHESSTAMAFGEFGNYNRVRVNLALARALPVLPVAALTAGNAITMNPPATVLTVSNTDPKSGFTIHYGNANPMPAATLDIANLLGPAGTLAENTSIAQDAALGLLSNTPQFFQSLFGMDTTTYSRQPASVLVDCAGGCTSATPAFVTAVANNPGRIVWIDGSIDLNSAGTLGSAVQPLMLVASGDVALSAQVTVNGFIYSGRDVLWNATAAGSLVRGAVVASRDFVGASPVTVAYDADMMERINRGYGSFVRQPGSWQVVPTR